MENFEKVSMWPSGLFGNLVWTTPLLWEATCWYWKWFSDDFPENTVLCYNSWYAGFLDCEIFWSRNSYSGWSKCETIDLHFKSFVLRLEQNTVFILTMKQMASFHQFSISRHDNWALFLWFVIVFLSFFFLLSIASTLVVRWLEECIFYSPMFGLVSNHI